MENGLQWFGLVERKEQGGYRVLYCLSVEFSTSACQIVFALFEYCRSDDPSEKPTESRNYMYINMHIVSKK